MQRNGEWGKEDEWEEWMEYVSTNGFANNGQEMMWMMLSDSRFEDYDKYFIGHFGLNEMFHVTPWYWSNMWGEYFFLSKYIKQKKIRYLPEYIDDLYKEYHINTIETGMNLYETESRMHPNKKSRIKLYKKEEANGQT